MAEVNATIQQLRDRRVDRIIVPEPGSGFRVSNMICAFNQAQIRRCLQLIESAHRNVYAGAGLTALMDVRGIYETVAGFLHFEAKLQDLLKEGDLQKIHDFVSARSFSTRLEHLIEEAGTKDVQATSVLTQIERMAKTMPDARKDYDHLCEYTHPNAFGAFLYFAQPSDAGNVVTFSDAGPDPKDDLHWVLVGGHLLSHLVEALERIDAALPGLSDRGREQRPEQI
ncbi:hypothetical protein VY88_33085 [Azospirillum thiophilum]|uniref:Uncharacterized protein n=1 Tax=Azospirillum thiophilum TaxID=528244 RepID=A0AAC8W636_9PROT|nr:hypothetical protein AL072_33080 [Azospirillum thiophilum]KJR61231.1 hypothetical protein VY88_33085 [Azospirillum thiophilum]